jgi:hypothetical protein
MKKSIGIKVSVAVLGVLASSLFAATQSPQAVAQESAETAAHERDFTHLKFHGELKAPNGKPEMTSQTVTFTVSDRAGDGAVRWVETQTVKPDSEGRYTALIGSSSPVGMQPELKRDHPILYVAASHAGLAPTTTKVVTTPQGIYQDCNLDGQSCSGLPEDTAISQLQQIASGGFTLVLNYSSLWGTPAQLATYAAAANTYGVNIIWSFDDPDFATYAGKSGNYLINDYSELGAACKCTTNKAFIEYVIGLVSKFPATYGYSLADEPVNTTGAQVRTLYNIVHAADPKHDTIINATFDDLSVVTLSNLQKNLDPFYFADVLGTDYYPYDTGAPISYTAPAAKDTQTIATNNGKKSEFILQASAWQEDPSVCQGPCLYPTVSIMQTMLDDAAANMNPAFFLWFSYYDTVTLGQWQNLLTAANPQP